MKKIIKSKYHNKVLLINVFIFLKRSKQKMMIYDTGINKQLGNGKNILF
jgi:hypothetical protein